MSEEREGWSLVAYRVGQVESKLDDFTKSAMGKLDIISQSLSTVLSTQAVHDVEIKNLKEADSKHSEDISKLETRITDIRITIAERLIPGAISGGLVAGLVEIARFLGGV